MPSMNGDIMPGMNGIEFQGNRLCCHARNKHEMGNLARGAWPRKEDESTASVPSTRLLEAV